MVATSEPGGIRSGAIRRSLERLEGHVRELTEGAATLTTDLAAVGDVLTYVPVLGGTGWSLGSTGSIAEGRYALLGDDVVWFGAYLKFGTVGMTFGAGQPTVTLPPFEAVNHHATGVNNRTLVQAYFGDSTGNPYSGVCQINATTVAPLPYFISGSWLAHNNMTSANPFAWAQNDVLVVGGTYQRNL